MWGSLAFHLTELRVRLGLVLISWLALWVVGWTIHPHLFEWLTTPMCTTGTQTPFDGAGIGQVCALVSTTVVGGMWARLWVSGVPAVLVGVPIAVWQCWLYCAGPASRRLPAPLNRVVWPRVSWVLLGLWLVSVVITILIAHPVLGVLMALGQPWVTPLITVEAVLSALVGLFVAILGLVCLPVALGLALHWHLVTPSQLRRARHGIVLGALIIAAFITPTTDPVTMVAVSMVPIATIEVMCLAYSWWAPDVGTCPTKAGA